MQMIAETKINFENKDLKKSGLLFKKIDHMTLHYVKYVPLKAGSLIELPACIANSRSCINIKNTNDFCFKYAVLCMVHEVHKQIHPERVSKYKDLLNTTPVRFDGLPFPMPVNKIDKFEQLNDNKISVNVFDLQDWTDNNATRSKKVRPIRLTKIKAETHDNLLYLTDGEKSHSVPIHKFDTLMVVHRRVVISTRLSSVTGASTDTAPRSCWTSITASVVTPWKVGASSCPPPVWMTR